MNLVYTEKAERIIAHENAQWTAYAEYPLLSEQEMFDVAVRFGGFG